MKNLKRLLTMAATLSTASLASADITWDWSWNSEAGQFITTGDLVGNAAPAATYTILDFTVTQTGNGMPIGSLSGGEYAVFQAPQWFDWDGATATTWYRANGTQSNGSNFAAVGVSATYLFSPGSYSIYDPNNSQDNLDSSSTLAMSPVPEPTSIALLSLGGLIVARRRRGL